MAKKMINYEKRVFEKTKKCWAVLSKGPQNFFFFQESVRNFFRKRFGWSASGWSIFKAFLVTMKIFC